MNVRDLLITLLRNALRGEALDIDAVRASLNDNRMATLFKVAKGHDVAHLVAYALEQNGFCSEEKTWQLFLKEKEQATLRYEMMQADIGEICACFDCEKIDYILLKGAVVRGYYSEPWMRTSCDIDILVREPDLEKAVSALVEKHTYRVENKKEYHDISLYSPFGTHLELHHSIKENIAKYDQLLTQVWDFSSKANENSFEYVQSKEFLMLHLTAHMAYHFVSGGCGVRPVIDLWLINTRFTLDKDKLNEMLEKAELKKFYDVIVELGEYWLGKSTAVGNTVLETEKFVLLGGAYGTSGQMLVAQRAKKGSGFKYILSRIFLPYENLAVLYPVVKKHKILVPFCHIARWFSAIFKRKKVKKELEQMSNISKEQEKSTAVLFDRLGL